MKKLIYCTRLMKELKPALLRPVFHLSIILVSIGFMACQQGAPQHDQANFDPQYKRDTLIEKDYLLGLPSIVYEETFGPIVTELNKHLTGRKLKVVAPASVEDYDKKVKSGYFDLIGANGGLAIEAENEGYSIFCKLANDKMMRGVLVVRKNSGIYKLEDMRGKSVSLPGLSALVGTMMPIFYMDSAGVDTHKELKKVLVPSAESAMLNVLLGKTDAAGGWILQWNQFKISKPDQANQLREIWVSPPTVGSALLVKKESVAAEDLKEITNAFLNFHKSEGGRRLLEKNFTDSFQPASSSTYQPIKDFLKKYNDRGLGKQ